MTRRLRKSFEGPPSRRIDLDVEVVAIAGDPLRITGSTTTGHRAEVQADEPLEPAETSFADLDLMRSQLGRLGGTIYRLGRLDAVIEGRPMVPKSLLNRLRRELVSRLDTSASHVRDRALAPTPVLPQFLASIEAVRERQLQPIRGEQAPLDLAVLCRRTEQIEAAVGLGISTIYADYQDIKQYARCRDDRPPGLDSAGDLPGHSADREAGRDEALRAISPVKGPTASWCETPAASHFAPSAAFRSSPISR